MIAKLQILVWLFVTFLTKASTSGKYNLENVGPRQECKKLKFPLVVLPRKRPFTALFPRKWLFPGFFPRKRCYTKFDIRFGLPTIIYPKRSKTGFNN